MSQMALNERNFNVDVDKVIEENVNSEVISDKININLTPNALETLGNSIPIIISAESCTVDLRIPRNEQSEIECNSESVCEISSECKQTCTESNIAPNTEIIINTDHSLCDNNNSKSVLSSSNDNIQENTFSNLITKDKTVDIDLTKTLTTSTVSLNDNCNIKYVICKSPISRSAEDISNYEKENSSKELNPEEVLKEFANQKTKVSAVHKIAQENINTDMDSKYSRINKEIMSHDLGSIVKNVHGIFSSMSGSLKTAYNISQKASTQFKYPIKNNVTSKSLINGRLINDIFEDNGVEKSLDADREVSRGEEVNHIAECVTTNHVPDKECDVKKDVVELKVESLERILVEQRRELSSLHERVRQQADELRDKDQTFKELETKLDMMCKRVEHAEREKDAAVMRYASGECAIIEARRAAELAQKAEKLAQSEVELLNSKLKTAHSEKQRICQLYDDKCHELLGSERELTKVREDLKELDGRLKWTQSKLRLEMDVNKECTERAEKLSCQVAELEAAKETAAVNANDTLRAKQLETELKECRASLIMCRHEKEELDRKFSAASQQLEHCRKDLDETKSSLVEHKSKVEELSASNLRLEEEAASLASLRAQASLADALASQLQRETERASQAEEELSKERARAETCARREAAALEHSARLTASHVAVSASTERAEAKAQALSADNAALREKVGVLEANVLRLETALAEEVDRRNKENRVFARKVAELTEESQEANKKLEWEKGENAVLKKKHANAIKEINRELQRALKRCEQLESKVPQSEPDASTRTGSVTSLSSGEGHPQTSSEELMHNGHAVSPDTMPEIQVREPDRQALIERIVSLQRAAARRSERCDFLEEHAKQLTVELRKKCRVLRQLMCSLPSGALASKDSDDHKKEIAKLGGGAMAAVWGGDPAGMTLDLSIEMNKRLQAVLEDTLLKNITLKENIDTLGEEISRLKGQHGANSSK